MDSLKDLRHYDFIRFTYCDLHGISRAKTVCKSSFEKLFKDGAASYVGSLGFGITGSVKASCEVHASHPAVLDKMNGNLLAIPVPETLHPLPSSGGGKYRVGELLCETFYAWSRERQEECPRYIARRELSNLFKLGYELYSSYEIEFLLLHSDTCQPVFKSAAEMLANITFGQFEDIFFEITTDLEKMGVEIETLQTEYSGGQFEIVLKPQVGIKIADNAFLTKDCVKTVARKHGLTAVFMTRRTMPDVSNGTHFNHSLRNHSSDHSNAFSNITDVDKLSDVFRAWMGGLTSHYDSLHAICSPTTNCYHRLGQPWAPVSSNWGIEDRLASFRVKNETPEASYIESRLPSGSSNPYIVLAVTVAAGRDGLVNKTSCPAPTNISDGKPLGPYIQKDLTHAPKSLPEALGYFKEDSVLVESLGPHFVKWFTLLKEEEIEIVKQSEKEVLEAERDLYMYLL